MFDPIIEWALTYRRTVVTTLILLCISGLVAWYSIPRESDPDVTIPMVYVGVYQEGISPNDAERLIVRPLENELRGLEGLKEMTSNCTESNGQILLEFNSEINIKVALADVRSAVDRAQGKLPQAADDPVIEEINFADIFPMVYVNLSGDVPTRTLVKIARNLRDKLQSVPEVLDVDINGDREEVVDIIVDPTVLENYSINQGAVFTFAAANNQLVPAGTIDNGVGRQPIKVPGLFENPVDILSMPVLAGPDRVLSVSDLAVLQSTFKDPESIARVNGKPSISLAVKKRSGSNIINGIKKVRAIVEQEAAGWPSAINVNFSQDQSVYIEDSITDLMNNVLSAIILVLIVVIASMGWRSGILVGIAVPTSFITGVLILYLTGSTLNMMVLFSLIMASGMLVDGAIVVVEFADRKMVEGMGRYEAYLHASQRMAMPVIASTVTTLAAFFPILFWPGIMGDFMMYLPLTLIYTLTASLFMALIFVPVLGSIFGKPGAADHETMLALAASEHGDVTQAGGWTGLYAKTLKVFLHRPWTPVIIAIASLIVSIFLYATFGRGVEFFPDVDPETAIVDIRMRGDMSIHEMDTIVREVEASIADVPGIKVFNSNTGVNIGGGLSDKPEDVHGELQLEFENWQVRPTGNEILDMIRERTRNIPGIVLDIQKPDAGPPVGKAVQLQLSSRNSEDLEMAADLVTAKFQSMKGLVEITDSRPTAGIEWHVDVDRTQAARYGADVATVGNAVQLATTGVKLGDFRPEDVDEEVDIRLRYPVGGRTLGQIESLRVNANGTYVPLSSFVEFKPERKVSSILRKDCRRVVTVASNVAPGVLPDNMVAELRSWLDTKPLPNGVEVTFRGQDEEQAKSQEFLTKAFFVAMFLIAIILLTQFNSFYETFLILTAVIFSTVGVYIGLLITDRPFSIVMNGIGVISLAGIVVNNNIVLIDTFNFHRKNGMELMEAVLRTGAQRLRPVMLTSVTTILGLVPMVFMMNVDFFGRSITFGAPSTQWWQQLATSIAFGLAFSTFLTLVVTPSLLFVGDRATERRRAKKAAKLAAKGA
jgi:multidrug efflux pump